MQFLNLINSFELFRSKETELNETVHEIKSKCVNLTEVT